MEILSSRVLLTPSDAARARHFYGEVLGLATYREYGPVDDPGVVFFAGQGLLEVSTSSSTARSRGAAIWMQVRDVRAERQRLERAGVPIAREPQEEPWGLVEMWIEDPEGLPIALVEVPASHPLRRDTRFQS